MSLGQEVAPAPGSELPAIATPVRKIPDAPRKRRAKPVLAVLGAAGLTLAIIAPTGAALTGPVTPAAQADTGTFSQIVAQSQNLAVESELLGAFEGVDRGEFEIYVKPKPKPVVVASSSGGSGGGSAPRYTGGGAPAEWMAAAGIAESDRGFVDYIVRRESGWNPNATNKRSGACGLVQVYPCSKLANAYDPVVNLRWANGYANGRYGSWEQAYNFWTRNHWW